MTYALTSTYVGCQPIANTETTQKLPLGSIVKAFDSSYGEGEFIYLTGVANTAVGSIVTYNPITGATTLAPAGTNVPQPVAVAMSANVANQYGWYQISGVAVCAKNQATASFATGNAVGISATGVLSNTSTGAEVQGAVASSAATASAATVNVLINRPHMQGRIT